MFKSFRKKIANLNVKQKKKKNLPKSRFTCIITKFSIPSTFHSRIFRNIINLDIRWLLKRKIILEQLCSKAFKRKPSWNVILKTRNLKKKGKPTRGEPRFDVSFAAYHYETFFFTVQGKIPTTPPRVGSKLTKITNTLTHRVGARKRKKRSGKKENESGNAL